MHIMGDNYILGIIYYVICVIVYDTKHDLVLAIRGIKNVLDFIQEELKIPYKTPHYWKTFNAIIQEEVQMTPTHRWSIRLMAWGTNSLKLP